MGTQTAETSLQRIEKLGIKSASYLDLLAVAVAETPDQVGFREEAALALVKRFGPERLLDLSPDELAKLSGMNDFSVLRMQCLIELGRRGQRDNKSSKRTVDGFPDVAAIFQHLQDETKEHFCALYLNSKNGVLSQSTIHIGTVNMSVVGPREVFREGVRLGAASLIVVHNHPSGDPTPSPEDMQVTKKLAEVGKMLDIPLLDHVIIGNPENFSFRQKGLL